MTIRGYARHLSVSHVYVLKLIKLGKIPVHRNGKKISINPVEADKALQGALDPSRDHLRHSRITRKSPAQPEKAEEPPTKGAVTWQDARTQKEHYSALLAKLEFEEKVEQLVRIDDVRKGLAEMVKMTRDRILATARRLAPMLVGKNVEHEIADTIYQELEDELRSLKDNWV